ncbi:MAG: hypothetical protein ACRBEE_01295 [Arenicella sp.]
MFTKKSPSQQLNTEPFEKNSEATVTNKVSGEYKKVRRQIDRMRTIAKRAR